MYVHLATCQAIHFYQSANGSLFVINKKKKFLKTTKRKRNQLGRKYDDMSTAHIQWKHGDERR